MKSSADVVIVSKCLSVDVKAKKATFHFKGQVAGSACHSIELKFIKSARPTVGQEYVISARIYKLVMGKMEGAILKLRPLEAAAPIQKVQRLAEPTPEKRIRFSTFLTKYMEWPEAKDFSVGDPETVLDEVPAGTDPLLVWTVLDCDGKLYLTSGWHKVNRMGHIVAKVPRPANININVIGF